eukprot:TRINITY_DN12204_c1_g1_i1.p1 TRINITY_DN12204_c1_g1~~TRINITY_DN12204_c1_g1_i1.p1  ORF type:complete len:220 (+),score=35.86 TRINITY_DN12204_c1_g1_i1:141-800(+)
MLRKKIEGHECGRYREDLQQNANEAKRQLDRYIHYFGRFKTHRDSSEKEDQLKSDLTVTVDDLLTQQSKNVTQQEISWAKGSLDTLFEARRIISNSYALAFYMFDYQYIMQQAEIAKKRGSVCAEIKDQNAWLIKQVLFEDQQQMLEQVVERLSGLLQSFLYEENKTNEYISQCRYSSMNLACTIHQRLKNMYQVVEDELLPFLGDGESSITTYMQIQL